MSTPPDLPAPNEQTPPTAAPRQHRWLLVVGLSVLVLLIFAALFAWYWVRSGRVNRYAADQIVTALGEYGIRAEIGGFEIGRGLRTATLRNVKLYNQQTGQLIATLKRVTVTIQVREPYALRLRREVVFQELQASGLRLYVNIDEQGRSNFLGVHQAPPRAPSRITFDTSSLVASLGQSVLYYKNNRLNLAAEFGELKAQVRPLAGSNPPVVNFTLNSTGGRVTLEGREVSVKGLDLAARASEHGAEIERFGLSSDVADVNASGRVDNFQSPRYRFDTQARVVLDEAARLFAPGTGLSGEAAFKGQITGENANYRIVGHLGSDDLRSGGVRVRGAEAQDVTLEPQGDSVRFTARLARAQAVANSGFNASDATVTAVNGTLSGGRTEIKADRATLARATASTAALKGIMLQNIAANFGNQTSVRGDLTVSSGTVNKVSLGQTRGQLVVTPSEAALNNFTAALMGGSAKGNLALRLRGGASRVHADFSGLRTGELFAAAGTGNPPLAGTVTGRADVTWPGTNVARLSGTINADFAGQTTETPNAIPLTGNVTALAANGLFNFDRLSLTTGATTLDATGSLSLNGNSDLRFTLTSSRAEELQSIAYSIPATQEALNTYEPTLTGDFRFEGTLNGPLTNPTIAGDVNAANFGLQSAQLGSVTGHLLFSPQEIRFENGMLTATNGGTARINYAVPRDERATSGKLDVTFERLNVDNLVVASGFPIQQKFVSGEISGEAHLTGLPAEPQGQVSASLAGGTLAGQPAEATTLVVNFDRRTARVDRFEARLPQGSLSLSGSLDLQTRDFQAAGHADQINLATLSDALELGNVTVTGTANATFQASGNTENLDKLKVELNAGGQQITINGQDAGELKLTARTSAGGRVDLELETNVTGQPQPITASVELRRPGRPVTVESNLNNFDLKPLFAIFAPGLAASLDSAVSGRLRLAGPLENERGEFSLAGLSGNLTLSNVTLVFAGNRIGVETPLTVSLANNELRIERTRFYGQNTSLNLGGLIGLAGSAGFNFSLNGNVNLAAFNALGSDYIVGGLATVDARLTGTGAAPRLLGEIRLSDVSLSSLSSPVAIDEGKGRMVFAGDRILLQDFTALANDGFLMASGEAALEGLQPTKWQVNLTGQDVNLYYRGARIVADGQLTLNGTPQTQTLSGRITVPVAEYTSNFSFDSLATGRGGGSLDFGGGFSGGGSSAIPPVNLDIRVEAADSFLIRNEQVNTVASALLNVGGTLSDPDIRGRVTLEGGTIKFRGQRYDITTGTMFLPGGFGTSPQVNLVAEGDVRGYHLYVGFVGPLNDVQVTLRSEPDLARSEILALITTGSTEGGTLNSDSIRRSSIGTAASLLSEEFISQPLGKEAEKFLGLNRFQIDPVLQPNANPAARLTIGRQIARNLSFTYSTNLASEQDQTLIVEYNLTNRFSAIASYTQGGSSRQQGSRDNDFTIEVRGRKRFALGTDRAALAAAAGASATAAGVPAPPRPPKRELPHATVDLNKPETVKISQDRLRDLLPVMREGYSRALTRLGERNLTNYLQEQGYFFAEVQARCEPANCSGPDLRVLYDVSPGERYDLRDIRITGTEELNRREVISSLESQTGGLLGGVPFFERLPFIGGTARGITSNDRLRNDREAIRRRMVDLGYRSARVTSRLAVTPETNDLVVIFDVEEGPRSVIADVDVRGNAMVAASELKQIVPVEPGASFTPTGIRQGAQQIRNYYAEHGFLDAKVEPTIEDLPDNRVRLVYMVSEGARAVVNDVKVAGNVISKESSIRRFFQFKPGDVLTPKLIERTQRDLYATGAFREVNIRHELLPGGDLTARQVTVGVTEAQPLLLVYGLGYSTDEGARALASLTHTNLFGRVNSGSLRLRGSRREQLAQLTFTDLRPFGSRWATTFSTFYNRNADLLPFVRPQVTGGGTVQAGRTFGINRFAAFIQSEHKLSDILSVRLRYSFENAKLFNLQNIPETEVTRNERAVRLGIVSAGISRDTRDSVLAPTRGQLMSADFSLAARVFGGNESFNKFFGQYQRYYTLGERLPLIGRSTLAFSARVGLAGLFKPVDRDRNGQIDEPERQLPISERFFSGGATTLRGFRFEQAGPQGVLEPRNANELPTLVPLGGDALMVFNFEWRYPLTHRMQMVPFYDLGNVFRNARDIFRSRCVSGNLKARNLCVDWTSTVGLGLRINTPIGPVGVDYGYLLDPPSFVTATGATLRQPRGIIHVRFGQTF